MKSYLSSLRLGNHTRAIHTNGDREIGEMRQTHRMSEIGLVHWVAN